MITFGLFNGVIFLPVLLSYIGPEPYQKNKSSIDFAQNDKDPNEQEQLKFIRSENCVNNNGKLTVDGEDCDDDDDQKPEKEQN